MRSARKPEGRSSREAIDAKGSGAPDRIRTCGAVGTTGGRKRFGKDHLA